MSPEPDPVVQHAPWSIRVTDLVVLLFGSWTVLVNSVVLAEGGLGDLFRLLPWAGLVLVLGLVWWYRAGPDPAPQAPVADRPQDVSLRARVVLGLMVALAIAVLCVTRNGLLGWWLVAGTLLLSWIWVMPRTTSVDQRPQEGPWIEAALWLVAAAIGVFAFGFHRADYDDALYVNFAVAAADDPDLPLLKYDTLHGVPDMPVMFPLYKSTSIEILGAALSKATGWPVMQVFHWVFPALFAALGTLAFARLLRLLVPSAWLWCTLIAMLLFAFGGPARKSYEILFWRSQEGKSAYLLFCVPLLLVYGQRFAEHPSLRRWLLLCLAQVGAAGLTANGLWTAPAAAGLGIAAGVPFHWRSLGRVALGLLASGYVLALAVFLFLQRPSPIVGASAAGLLELASRAGHGMDFVTDAARIFFGRKERLVLGLSVTFLAWAFCSGPRGRRLALTVPLGLLVCLWNPYLANPLARMVTGHPTYVRVLWSLPTPAFVALALAAPLLLPGKGRRRLAAYLVSALLVTAYVARVPRYNLELSGTEADATGTGREQKSFSFLWNAAPIRAPEGQYEIARQLCMAVPPRSMVVAPKEISVWIPTIEGYSYPLVCRAYYFQFIRPYVPKAEQDRRLAIQNAISNLRGRNAPAEDLLQGIRDYDLQGVVLHRRGPYMPENLGRLLYQEGFRQTFELGPYQVWARGEPADQDGGP